MKNYIEREALMKRMEERLASLRKEYGNYDHYTDGYEEGCVAVEYASASDVVERKRGEWVQIGYDELMDRITCSCCNEYFSTIDNCTEQFNFCPNCGADMRSHQNILCDQTEEVDHEN